MTSHLSFYELHQCPCALQALNVKSSLATLEALLEEAPETAEDDEAEPALLESLKERVESAQDFYRRAKAIMERVEAAPAADGDQAMEQAVAVQQQAAAVQSAPEAVPATTEAPQQQQQDAFADASDPAEQPSSSAWAVHPGATAQAAAPQRTEQQLAVDVLTGAEPQQQPDVEPEQQGRPSVEELAELLDEGADLGVKFDMLPQLVSLLEAANAWVEQAELCLQLADEQQQRQQREQDALAMRRQQLDSQVSVALPYASSGACRAVSAAAVLCPCLCKSCCGLHNNVCVQAHHLDSAFSDNSMPQQRSTAANICTESTAC